MFKAVIRRIMSVMLVTAMICTSSGVTSCFAGTVSDEGITVEAANGGEEAVVEAADPEEAGREAENK